MDGQIDYSGPYQPDLKLEDFSREALANLVRLYARLFLVIDGLWYIGVKDDVSNDKAVAIDIWAWERMIEYESRRLIDVMNIRGNDVATFMKLVQVDPLYFNMDYEIELDGANYGVITIKQCPTLKALEKEGGGRIKDICGTVDPLIFPRHAKVVNPDIEVKALKTPPRQSPDEVCCRWEYSLR